MEILLKKVTKSVINKLSRKKEINKDLCKNFNCSFNYRLQESVQKL